MTKRWTIKELEETRDSTFIRIMLNDRKNQCTNPYSPLATRLGYTIDDMLSGKLLGGKIHHCKSGEFYNHLTRKCTSLNKRKK